MEPLLWIMLPGFVAAASGVLVWFVMQAQMEVAIANERATLAETRGALEAERTSAKTTFKHAVRAAEESARRQAFDSFLDEISVEQRHYTRENRALSHNRKSLILQERIFFRNLPLSDWIEHEIVVEDGMDIDRLVQDMTVFDKGVINISEAPRVRKALA